MAEEGYTHYPAKYFSASPTFFAWNALTCADVHTLLQTRPGFEGQNLYFVRNHPVRYVRLVGLVVGIELIANGKYLLLCLDDGSGATIECKVEVRKPKIEAKVDEQWPSNTFVDNLNVIADMGLAAVSVDGTDVEVGTVVKAKGTVESFRDVRQLKLERIFVVKDTNAEVKAWKEATAWKAEKFAKPWVLTEREIGDLEKKLQVEKVQEMEGAKKRRARDAKHAEKRRRHEEKKERKRRVVEGEFDSGALAKSAVLPDR